ncbi:MAG: hypothetical protein CGW95_16195 [Phenylobacterium zucineum]|nr:MAG: hypothetical protein CGW95_16195 [Phenylobacterium zucineum]
MLGFLRLLVVLLAIAGTADAQQLRGAAPPEVAGRGLRGSVAADRMIAPIPVPRRLNPERDKIFYGTRPVIQPLVSENPSVSTVIHQCRTSCAQRYYFCLAKNYDDDCATLWGQCRAECSVDSLPTSY